MSMRIAKMAKKDCSGCRACANICPKVAIIMRQDEEGFYYPVIDEAKCVGCGLCEKACPVLPHLGRLAYAYISGDKAEREKSSSGGIFSVLARYIISLGGVVAGAAFDKNWNVEHVIIESEDDLDRLRRSKYVQSNTRLIYKETKSYLNAGKTVLFTGTPCQVEALRAYLGRDYEKLILMDIICHGVPSTSIWAAYVKSRSVESEVIGVNFRSANLSHTWERYALEFLYKNSKAYLETLDKDPYMKFFLQDIGLRPSCYNCHFRGMERNSDFTIADFWGVDHVVSGMNDHKGTSLVVLHTDKAKNIFQLLPGKKKQVALEEAVRYNPAMVLSPAKNDKRDALFSEFNANPQEVRSILRKYTELPLKKKIFQLLRKVIRKI